MGKLSTLAMVNEMGVISLTTYGALIYFMNKEEIQLAKLVVTEIKTLRNQNEIMAARLDMFDSMMLLFTSSPAYANRGMSPDIVYDLEKRIAKSEDDLKAESYPKEK